MYFFLFDFFGFLFYYWNETDEKKWKDNEKQNQEMKNKKNKMNL